MKIFSLSITVLILAAFVCVSQSLLSCLDESNSAVDWFIALKYPKGFSFVYLTSNNIQWKVSRLNLSSNTNMVALTLRQSYVKQNLYAYYNDEPVKTDIIGGTRGHLKGVLNFDESSGYWLIHSVPKFPLGGSYQYKVGEETYAQSFICVTVRNADLGPIVRQLLMMQSTVYSYNIPTNFSTDPKLMSDLNTFVKNENINTPYTVNKIELYTLQRVPLIHFGKSHLFNADLYAGLIAPSLQTPLYVESWIRGERISSSCYIKFKVYNVEEVNLPNNTFKESEDHSKWAVSTSAQQPYVCIGDINRMKSQFKRGGGSMCIGNKSIWNVFQAIVASYEHCP